MHWGSVWHVGGFTQAQKSNIRIGANTLENNRMAYKSELEFPVFFSAEFYQCNINEQYTVSILMAFIVFLS